MDMNSVRAYWEARAMTDSSAQSTTQDVYLRQIELQVLSERISFSRPAIVADLGCGDGRTTISLARQSPYTEFVGYDYSDAMVANAQNLLAKSDKNVEFYVHDATSPLPRNVDLVYTTRCLINLPSWDLQQRAIRNIWKALPTGGTYIAIENFVEGHNSFNEVRAEFGLPEIPIREHNLFFNREQLAEFVSGLFSIDYEVNISSTYYLVSRVHYSKLCADTGATPDYFDMSHAYASRLPFSGEFGPVRLMCLRKV